MPRVGDEIGPCLSLEELARNGLAGARPLGEWPPRKTATASGACQAKAWTTPNLRHFAQLNGGASVAQTQQGRLNQLQTPFGQ
jgi:hypothetical protein